MKLEDIGFYTLSDSRAKEISIKSPMWRCELILTERCNFKCPYCRGLRKDCQGDMTFDRAKEIVDLWAKEGLKNVRFSGGEPVVWKDLPKLITHTKERGVERIAISTNGSAPLSYYKNLIKLGVDDFSISLDACCSSYGEEMCGGIPCAWERVIDNIKELSKLTYVTVGIVFTEKTINTCKDVVKFAHDLGVSDIRVISSAQYNEALTDLLDLDDEILDAHPILKYRINNFRNGREVRGLKNKDSRRCHLVQDDMAIAGNYHFPCIIYLREGGKPIGEIGPNMREERVKWSKTHDCHQDKICKNNCLDVCIDFNNKV
jgi:molybdenum cofactor biosynthesis enzyme MoaA